MVFKNKSVSVSEMFEGAKFRAWFWLHGNSDGFSYSFSDWMLNPRSCLNLT